MALTSNKSLSELFNKVEELKLNFIETASNIQASLDRINSRLFQERTLELSNDSWENVRKKRNYLLTSKIGRAHV